ncbi:MAG: metal-dependent hydrolase [Verrucomicrobiota bacterium]
MKIRYFGHACFSVETAGGTLLFDPFITPNEKAGGIELEQIQADFVLLTHGHEDHVADAEAILKRTGALLIANYEIVSWFQQRGIQQAHPLNHGGGADFAFGRATFVQAVHSSVLPDGTYGGNPGGFVIEAEGETFYNSGDTALTLDMKLVGEKWAIDWAALCLGDNFTMGPEDAARAAEFVGTQQVLGIHYDTFPYIEIDREAAQATFSAKGIELHLPPIGGELAL